MSDQAEKLRQLIAGNKESNMKRAKMIAIASGKGGTGKTNFTVNFCLELSALHQKVLLFDLDIGMGNVDILLGESPEHSLLDFWKKSLSLSEMTEKSQYGIDYISGGRGFKDFFQLDGHHLDLFMEELDRLIQKYDFIFFDMGAGMTQESLQFLLAADEVFLVVTPEPTALMDAYSAAKYVLLNSKNSKISVLLNKAKTDLDGTMAYHRLSSVLNKYLSAHADLLGILPEDPKVSEAVIKRNPVTSLYPRAKYSRSIRQTAEAFLQKDHDRQNFSRPELFMDRFKAIFKSKARKGE
ncbi:MinD/ParA family protein [Bacillus sp. FJAT-42376]|uniref:MinD/ParA family protein n=1 Tax=Bacillus sp. FJAT-42376 TaxID=2014076 RepID=UPI000F4E2150|nr:MinD/ParA family protein [Bacillus sp. FJAT-42376]AZB42958.1 MinD/ParA family protein [Bacillus sp. FJAT-42376]